MATIGTALNIASVLVGTLAGALVGLARRGADAVGRACQLDLAGLRLQESDPRKEVLAHLAHLSLDAKAKQLPPVEGKTRWTRGVTGGLLLPASTPAQVVLWFQEKDPLAVTLHIQWGTAMVKGVMSRAAMVDALAGVENTEGRVILRARDAGFYLGFPTVETEADKGPIIRVSRADVLSFLASTYALVPIGEEQVDWDAEATSLGVDPTQLRDGA